MKGELIMNSDILDIVFEKRNKAYGAYTLRKFYNNRLIKSVAIMMVAVIVFSTFTFLPEGVKPVIYVVADPGFGKLPPAPKVADVKPKLKKPHFLLPVTTIIFPTNIVIVDNKDSTEVLHDLKDMEIGSKTNIVLNGEGTPTIPAAGTGTSGDIAPAPEKPAEPALDVTKAIDNPEVMPAFPGGMDGLRKFLMRNLTNPGDLEEGELISVKIKFVVGNDGKLKSFELVEDGGSEFNNEVIRVLKKMPAWIPGKSKGQNVSVYYTIPVKFIPEG